MVQFHLFSFAKNENKIKRSDIFMKKYPEESYESRARRLVGAIMRRAECEETIAILSKALCYDYECLRKDMQALEHITIKER